MDELVAYTKWRGVWLTARECSHNDEEELTVLRADLLQILTKSNFKSIWTYIIKMYGHNSIHTLFVESKQLVLGYRVVCNVFRTAPLSEMDYDLIVVTSFAETCNELSVPSSCINAIVGQFTSELFKQLIVISSSGSNEYIFKIIQLLDSNVQLKLFKIASGLKISSDLATILVRIFEIILASPHTHIGNISNELFFRTSLTQELLTVVSRLLTTAYSPLEVIREACLWWSDPQFTHIGKYATRMNIGICLCVALDSVRQQDLITSSINGMPTVALISEGISMCLDCSQHSIRQLGMNVAQSLARALNHPWEFNELQTSISYGNQKELTSPTEEAVEGDVTKDSSCCYESDSESESELNSIEVPERYESCPFKYLHICLEVLRESQLKRNHKDLVNALASIPILIKCNPIDLRDICPPLLVELLSINGSLDMNDSHEVLRNAILSLLVHVPVESAKILLTFSQADLCVAVRVELLALMCKAAFTLAHLGESNIIHLNGSCSSSSVCPTDVHNHDNSSKDVSKTRIKAPRKLELRKLQISLMQNNFGQVAIQYLHTVLQILEKEYRTSRSVGLGLAAFTTRVLDNVSLLPEKADFSSSKSDFESIVATKALQAVAVIIRCTASSPQIRCIKDEGFHCGWHFRSSTSRSIRLSANLVILEYVSVLNFDDSVSSVAATTVADPDIARLGLIADWVLATIAADTHDQEMIICKREILNRISGLCNIN